MMSGVNTMQPEEGNNCQIDRSGLNFNEVGKVVPKQSNEIGRSKMTFTHWFSNPKVKLRR